MNKAVDNVNSRFNLRLHLPSGGISFVQMATLILSLLFFSQMANAETRVALVIGNGGYDWSPLDNPANDARDMANTLKDLGFEVDLQTDMTRVGMHRAIREFGNKLARADVGLFYYAGHGLQVDGRNFLVPIGADILAEDEIAFETIDASRILAKMETARNPVNIVILDACRNNPFAVNSRSGSRGLARMESPVGSLLLYATAPNKTASDGPGRNGVLTGNLIKHLKIPGLALDQVVLRTRVAVMKDTGNDQVPWSASSLTSNVILNQQVAALSPANEQGENGYANSSVGSVSQPTSTLKSGIDTDGLLRICDRHFLANRLTTGAGGSALNCYQKVLERDPYNIAAFEGLDNIAIKYIGWAERALKAHRLTKATQHLNNLKMVNAEHPALEELEDAVRRAQGSGRKSNVTETTIASKNTANASTVAVSNTSASQLKVAVSSQSGSTTVANSSSDPNVDSAVLYEELFGSSGTTASSAQTGSQSVSTQGDSVPSSSRATSSLISDINQSAYQPTNTIQLASQASTAVQAATQTNTSQVATETETASRAAAATEEVTDAVAVESSTESDGVFSIFDSDSSTSSNQSKTKKKTTTSSTVTKVKKTKPKPAVIKVKEKPKEVEVALAAPTPQRPPELCPECFQPAARSGKPCIQLEVLQSAFVRSKTNSCHSVVQDTCMDVEYKFRIYNICRKSMAVDWRFATRGIDVIDGKSVLEKSGDATITCLHMEQNCAGRVRYAWDFTK